MNKPILRPRPLWACLVLFWTFSLISTANAEAESGSISIVTLSDRSDRVLNQEPVQWALQHLEQTLQDKGLAPRVQHNFRNTADSDFVIAVAPGTSAEANRMLKEQGVDMPNASEAFVFSHGTMHDRDVLLLAGSDVRGIVYGLLELADRAYYSETPLQALKSTPQQVEKPANQIRSIMRLFVSEIEDKPWYYDKEFWTEYLTMLATNRFNRFSLTLGLGHDAPYSVRDSYFIFAYPYLVSVPGFEDVKVTQLAEGEREKNLKMLQFISSEAAKRGLHFQLALWGHAYDVVDSPEVNYTIEGLNEDNHAAYCREAVRTLLEACPDIDGITFRAHYESGIPDGSQGFWETVFEGVASVDRRVEIDLHGKGITYDQIDLALNTGQPVVLSPKLASEHKALPAHAASIREWERRPSETVENPRNNLSRYSYADFLASDREYGIVHRIWPGLQKILMWGDPEMAAGYSEAAGFSNTQGLELCEPLTFKGRMGTGVSPERRIYADDSLIHPEGDWKKYLYTYRIWGRFLYDPELDPEAYRRLLVSDFGDAVAPHVETALGHASKVTPLMTSAHIPGISAMAYWPEMYTNVPIVEVVEDINWRTFGDITTLDPVLFSTPAEYAADFVSGTPSARYSPLDVAEWLERFATIADEEIETAKAHSDDADAPVFRRMYVDVIAQSRLGSFFADKLRSGTAFEIFKRNNEVEYLEDAVYFYRKALSAWRQLANVTNVYVENLDFGHFDRLAGHWRDRIPAIVEDLGRMEAVLADELDGAELFSRSDHGHWIQPRPERPFIHHEPPQSFKPGQPLTIKVDHLPQDMEEIKIHYRHVNQVEEYEIATMKPASSGQWHFEIPGDFTDANFSLMYFFELIDEAGNAWILPGYDPGLANQPYIYVARD